MPNEQERLIKVLEAIAFNLQRIADGYEFVNDLIKPKLTPANELPESHALERTKEIFPKKKSSLEIVHDALEKAPETKESDKCEYDGFTYTEFKECKYKCGHLVSWQNYKKGDKPIHFLRNDKGQLIALGKKCPKYSKEDENK